MAKLVVPWQFPFFFFMMANLFFVPWLLLYLLFMMASLFQYHGKMYYSIVEISMFVEHGKLYYSVMANYTIRSWQFSTRILPWLFSVCRPKEHGNFPFCSMVNLFFITMANFILDLLLQIFLFLTHGKFTFTAKAKLHIYHGNFLIFFYSAMAIFPFALSWQILDSLTWQFSPFVSHDNIFIH